MQDLNKLKEIIEKSKELKDKADKEKNTERENY